MSECLKFVFWNIHRTGANLDLITSYGKKNGVDIIALCEVANPHLANLHGYRIIEHIEENYDIAVLTKDHLDIFYSREKQRYCLLKIGSGFDINLAVVHLNSKLHSSGQSYRDGDIEGIISDLFIEELKYNNQNSLVVGDFNDDPYSAAMTGWHGFNAVFFKSSVGNGYRIGHDRRRKDVFYSPMIHMLRDSNDPSVAKGTYYFNKDWLCYDQVLMKLPLVQKFILDKACFISSIDETNLVNNHKPTKTISDHIPLYFEIAR